MTGGLIGLVGGLGAWLVLVRLPMMRRPTLDDRLAPYVRDVAAPSTLLREAPVRTPFGVLERLLRPVMGDAVRWVERLSGGPGTVRRRLDQLGGTHHGRAVPRRAGGLAAPSGSRVGLALARRWSGRARG